MKKIPLFMLLVGVCWATANWTLFSPSGSMFSVQVPYPMGDPQPIPEGAIWTGAEKGSALFMLSAANISSTPATRSSLIQAGLGPLMVSAKIVEKSRKKVQCNGLEGVEVEGDKHVISGQTFPATVRVMSSDRRIYNMIVIRFNPSSPSAQQFLESLRETSP